MEAIYHNACANLPIFCIFIGQEVSQTHSQRLTFINTHQVKWITKDKSIMVIVLMKGKIKFLSLGPENFILLHLSSSMLLFFEHYNK